jgi:aspartate racemase
MAARMTHVGIIAHSPDGSALCYLSLIREGHERFGTYGHGDITLDYIPMGRSMASWDAGDHQAIRSTLATSAARLSAAGADFFICPDNTAHIALEQPGPELALPGLHIGDVVADQAAKEGRHRVAVLGTRYTMQGPVYPRALTARGIDHLMPEPDEQQRINHIIFDELCHGILTEESRDAYLAIIERMKAAGCDAVALACTEIPLLISSELSPLPILDSTRLLARAAFEVSVGEREMPGWRGGPV